MDTRKNFATTCKRTKITGIAVNVKQTDQFVDVVYNRNAS